jgi:hypothetical protein
MAQSNILTPFVVGLDAGLPAAVKAALPGIYNFTGVTDFTNPDYVRALYNILGGWQSDAIAQGVTFDQAYVDARLAQFTHAPVHTDCGCRLLARQSQPYARS